jgi:hypothetical protein
MKLPFIDPIRARSVPHILAMIAFAGCSQTSGGKGSGTGGGVGNGATGGNRR